MTQRPVGAARSGSEGPEQDEYTNEADVQEVVVDDDQGAMEEDDDEDDEEDEEDEDNDEIVVEDVSISHFGEHKQAVFAVASNPIAPIAASGGEDDMAYLWDIATGEKIQALDGHTDSVNCVAFSSDGLLVATGGMDGKVRVWKKAGEDWKKWEFLVELIGPDELVWLQWHPKGQVLVAGATDSTVWMWQLPSGSTMHVFSGHTSSVDTGAFTTDGKKLLTGSSDGSLILWDPRSATPLWKLTADDARFGMTEGVVSVAINSTSTLAIVGGHGEVRVINLNKGEILGKLEGHQGESVEAVAFIELSNNASGPGLAVTGGTDGKVCIWDLSTMRLRTSVTHSDAVSALASHPAPKSHYIISASVDNTLKTWDARTGSLVKDHTGHRGVVHAVAIGQGQDGRQVVISGGDDAVSLVFDIE